MTGPCLKLQSYHRCAFLKRPSLGRILENGLTAAADRVDGLSGMGGQVAGYPLRVLSTVAHLAIDSYENTAPSSPLMLAWVADKVMVHCLTSVGRKLGIDCGWLLPSAE